MVLLAAAATSVVKAVAKKPPKPRSTDDIVAIVFVDIAIIVAVARIVGSLFKKIRQPAVVGEILAGIALGPSLLGAFPGQLPTRIFPTDIRPYLGVLAQLGLIIFMFIVGLEVDVALIRGKERIAGVISLSSIALPFGLGILLASAIHSSHTNAQAPAAHRFLPFALFIGASMSITAFPVLARILTERRMYRTEIGALALACAAVDDVVAWSLLALVLAIIKSNGALSLPKILLEALAYVAFMFLVVKPALERVAKRYREVGKLTPNIFAIILIGFLLSSFITERIGIHQIFGAFLFGVVMPRKETAQFFHDIVERLEQVSVLLLLPLFFIVTGFSVDVRHMGSDAFVQLPLILVVAIVGKLVGATVAARAQGLTTQKSAAIGVLMNTRGLTELIILNVGREFGVLDTPLFTMLVVMAIVTTIMTEPLLRLVYPEKALAHDVAEAERAALGTVDAFRILAMVAGDGSDDELIDTAADLIGDEAPSELVLTSFSQMRRGLEVGTGLAQELGQMATVLDRLKALARRAELRNVHSVIRSQFSDDVGGDLVAQAAAVEADIVLVPAPTDDGATLVGQLLSGTPSELVLIVHPQSGPGSVTDPRVTFGSGAAGGPVTGRSGVVTDPRATLGAGAAGGPVTGGSAGPGGPVTGGSAGPGGPVTGGSAGAGGPVSGGSAGPGGPVTGGSAGAGGPVSGGSAGPGGPVTGGSAGAGGGVTGGSGGAPGSVAVIVSEGANGAAAMELAARVAFSRHLPLCLIPETSTRKVVRQAEERAEDLVRARLDCRVEARGETSVEEAVAQSRATLVVAAVDDEGAERGRRLAGAAHAVVLLVRASADDDGRGLERWLRRSDAAPA
jgi:Kef-type K+ transport system membrane component KefB